MTLPRTHFFVRTKSDAFPNNKGKHPLCAVKIVGTVAFVAACSLDDNPCRVIARMILADRQSKLAGITFDPSKDTLASILKAAKVPRKVLAVLDMDRAERAFERNLEA
jgi:hypothetical protein